MENLGIENLKKAVKFGIDMGEALDASMADGKFDLTDSANFFRPLMELPSVVAAGKLALPEFKDMDALEAKELSDYVATELNITNDKVEMVIEKSFAVVVAMYEIYTSVKSVKALPQA
jgi:hypothetical protein